MTGYFICPKVILLVKKLKGKENDIHHKKLKMKSLWK